MSTTPETHSDPLRVPLSDQLGPLPEAPIIGVSRFGSVFRGYSAEHMRAYAAEQVAAERERLCAAIKAADDKAGGPSDYTRGWGDCLKAVKAALGLAA